MIAEEWNKKYIESIDSIKEKISSVKGVLTAYNTNIDAVIDIDSSQIDKLLRENPDISKNIEVKLQNPPREILEKTDVIAGLLYCMKNGTSEEWLIRNQEVYEWIKQNISWPNLHMGGQAGITANTLAKIGVSNVITNAPSLPKQQASLFMENVNIPVRKNATIILKSPTEAVRSDEPKMLHYVFNFAKGCTLRFNNLFFKAPTANKFVATWDPKNTSLEIEPAFFEYVTKSKIDRAILSGYHLLRLEYANDSKFEDKIVRTIHQIERWKKENPGLFIHLEMGDSRHPEIYSLVLKKVSPLADSIGLNEIELTKITSYLLGAESTSPTSVSAVSVFKKAKVLLQEIKTKIIIVHTLHFTIALVRKDKERQSVIIESIHDGLIFGAAIAAARASNSQFNNIEQIRQIIQKKSVFVSPIGLKQHVLLANFLQREYNVAYTRFLSIAVAEIPSCYVIYVTSKLTVKPETAAGLGDSLVSGYILGLNRKTLNIENLN